MNHYLIEFRFFGKAKYEMKQLIYEISHKFRLPKKRAIPHISLAGPIFTNNESKLVQDFKKLCSDSPVMGFEIDGFEVFEENRVVFIKIRPSQQLEEFRCELSKKLQPYCDLKKPYDYEREFKFHATIAMKLDPNKFDMIKEYIAKIKQPKFKHLMMRVTLIKNRLILAEYDFFQRRTLSRWEAKSRTQYAKSMDLLKEFFAGNYNSDKNIRKETYKDETSAYQKNEEKSCNLSETVGNYSDESSKKHRYVVVPKKGVINSILDSFKPPRIFLIADLHLNHYNILKFCHRPFNYNVKKMNQIIINNWNNTIRKKDKVFFLGDFDNAKHEHVKESNIRYLLPRLNGEMHFIIGNHDRYRGTGNILNVLIELEKEGKIKSLKENELLRYKNKDFYLVHDPKNIPQDWKGWSICGHHHNNRLKEYPFINGKTKQINVGVELIGYRPLDINRLFELDFEKIDFMELLDR